MKRNGPVFIVGMNGSGTTMLLDCLNNHPNLYGFHRESKIIPYYVATLGRYGDLCIDGNFLRLFNDIRNEWVFKKVNKGFAPPLPENWKNLARNLSAVIDTIFTYFSSKEGKLRWCEKTPMHALHILSLGQLFSDAKFIHLIRDGRSCAASVYRRWGYKPEVSIYRWKKVVYEGRRQGSIIGERYYEVYYEELTRSPEESLKGICTFLDIPFDDRVLKVSRLRTFTGSRSEGIISGPEKWRRCFGDKQLDRLERIAGKQLHNLGYQTEYPSSDVNPPLLLLKIWLYLGHFRSKLPYFLKAFSRNDGEWQWRKNWAIIIEAVKGRLTSKF